MRRSARAPRRSSPGVSWTCTTTPRRSPRSTSSRTSPPSEPHGVLRAAVCAEPPLRPSGALELGEGGAGAVLQLCEVRTELADPAATAVGLDRDALRLPAGQRA